jgi:plasmid stabilization system protein ParE
VKLAYHPLVQRDVSGILRHYDRISPRLGDEFWTELTHLIEVVSTKPERFHFAERELRRANMKRFPYHLLFRVTAGAIRVVVVRHDKRHPSYGTTRT